MERNTMFLNVENQHDDGNKGCSAAESQRILPRLVRDIRLLNNFEINIIDEGFQN